MFERVSNRADFWGLDVELEWCVGLKGDGCFETRDPEFGAEEPAKYLSDGGFGDLGGAGCDNTLLMTDFKPTTFVDVVGGIGAIRWDGTVRFTFVHDLDGFLVQAVQ